MWWRWNNLISISSGYAIGSYDLDQLQWARWSWPVPRRGPWYEGIGKGSLSIAHMPVLTDDLGPFGNPSSDSRRAMDPARPPPGGLRPVRL